VGGGPCPVEGMVTHSTAFWRGRRVLVTGHTGFKGGWLTLWLASLGAHVTGIALAPTTDPNLFDAAAVGAACDSRFADVRDARAVAAIVAEARPDIVFHLAAQPLVRASYVAAAETWDVNVMGTIRMLDACLACDHVRAVVVVTSDKCYEHGMGTSRPFREDDALGGHDPYSSSKSGAEIAVSSWRRSFFAKRGIGAATARAGNVIGVGDWSDDRLIPDLVRAAVRGDSVAIRSPRATRPWQHVLDPLAGYLTLAEALHRSPESHSEAWNFGPPMEAAWPVARVADAFVVRLDRASRWHADEDPTLHEAGELALDNTKARARLGWSPRFTTEQAIAATADGYRAMIDGGSLRGIVERQIAHHATGAVGALAA
jgi:CDP-glucose 4,6-dehydratase